MRQHLAIAALATALAALPLVGAAAQEATTGTTATGAELPQADMQFVEKAAGDGKAEVELGEMAVDKASAQEVKDFAQRMIDDHTQANEQLIEIAEQKQLEIPDELPPEAQEAKQRLEGLTEAEFDRAYMEHMVADHEKAVSLFEQQANTGQDPELQKFAQDTLPKLQEHLELAQQINTQLTQIAGTSGDQAEPSSGSPEETTAPAAGAAAGAAAGTAATTEEDPMTDPDTSIPDTQSHDAPMPGSDASAGDTAAADAAGADAAGAAATSAGETQQAAAPASPFGTMRADEIIGQEVKNDSGESIGEIQDIVINQQDQAVLAVVSVGGFLGIGDKHVAVPFEQLQKGEDNSILLSGMTEDELKQMPAYDEDTGTFEQYPRDRTLSDTQSPN